MMSPGNDLEIQFLGETDFGSVVAVESNSLEDVPEITFELLVSLLGNRVAVAGGAIAAGTHRGIVHGAEEGELLRRRSGGKIFREKIVALLVDIGKPIEKVFALAASGPFGEDDVNKFIDTRGFGAGCVRGGNDLIDHGDDGVVLMSVQSAERVSGSGVRSLQKCEEIRCKRRQNATGQEQFQSITPLHGSSLG